MYQVKVVLDEQRYHEVGWGNPMTWDDVLHYVRKMCISYGDDWREVGLAKRKVNEARWIVDRGNSIALNLVDDRMDEILIRQAAA